MSQGKKEARQLLWEILDNGHKALENLINKLALDDTSFVEDDFQKEVHEVGEHPILNCHDPTRIVTGA